MKRFIVLFAIAAPPIAGCSSPASTLLPGAADASTVAADAEPVMMPDPTPAPIAFTPDARPGGAAIFLRGAGASADRLSVDVVAAGIPDLHGAALRLKWDAAVLRLAEAKPSASWPSDVIALSKEGTPGQLAIVWSAKGGSRGIDASAEVVLGTLTFDAIDRGPTSLAFRPERSGAVDRAGARLAVALAGGEIPAR
jgi:hypothetical protein